MSAHTPGPWSVFLNGNALTLYVAAEKGGVVAFIGPEDEDANADLIAASPDMLAALQLIERNTTRADWPDDIYAALTSAINKATGDA